MLIIVAVAAALACAGAGGGLYEFSVVDPFWPSRPDLVQPSRGGISRKRFWISIHVAFEVTLIAALVLAWSQPDVRNCLLVALASHAHTRAAISTTSKATWMAIQKRLREMPPRDGCTRSGRLGQNGSTTENS